MPSKASAKITPSSVLSPPHPTVYSPKSSSTQQNLYHPISQKNSKDVFSPGVIRVHPQTKKVSVDKKSARCESMSREVYRHSEFEGCVQLARVRDHFLFCIESEGFYPPERLLPEAIQVMRTKIATLRRAAEALLNDTDANEDAEMTEA